MNKQYLVSEEYLLKYKKFCEDYMSHYSNCYIYTVERCTCGFDKRLKELQDLEKKGIKIYDK